MRPSEWAGLIIVLLVALGFRVYKIAAETIWFDECVTYMGLNEPSIMDLYRNEATRDPKSVPFYYGCAYLWYHMGFDSITEMRMLSVFGGMVVVTGIYFFARRFFGHIGGIAAALCVSCAKLHVYESQEIRNYTFTLSLALLAMFTFYQAAVANKRQWWVFNVAANILLVYTHLLSALLLFAQGVYLLLTRPKQVKGIALWTFAHAPFLAFIPVWEAIITTADFKHETDWIPLTYNLDRAIATYYYVFAGSKLDAPDLIRTLPFGSFPIQHLLGMALVIALTFFLFTCLRVWPKNADAQLGFKRQNALFLLVWAFVPPATLYVFGHFVHAYLERYVLYASLAVYMCIGGAVAALPRRWLQYGAIAALALIYCGNSVDMNRPLRYNVGAAGLVLRDQYAPGEHVYSWYDDLQIPIHFYGGVPENMLLASDDFTERAIAEAESGKRTWICFHEVPYRFEHENVEGLMKQHPDIAATRWHYSGRWHMYLYRLDPSYQNAEVG
jgi:uncharacterized membrane protein